MPKFGHKDSEPQPATVTAPTADDDSDVGLGSAEAIGAQGRERIAAISGSTFSADMTDGELLWTHKCGFAPLGVVLGNSVYHIGMQLKRWSQNQEVEVLTQAMQNARDLATTRMLDEAQQLGADGVLVVEFKVNRWAWETDLIDVTVAGTAVRYSGEVPLHPTATGRPFTTSHGGSMLWKLLSTGYQPMGLVFGNTVFHIAHQGINSTVSRIGRNVEMTNYTQAVYDARELAMTRMHAAASRLGASGVGAVTQSVLFHGWGDHVMEYYATGNSLVATSEVHDFKDPAAVFSY
jgi:uncharacterized protein YbjQ (UPF0145 family)